MVRDFNATIPHFAPQRGKTYQPRATPWVLKGRYNTEATLLAQSLSRILLHIVFSTKNREPWIPESVQSGLYAYIAGTCRALGSEAYRVGGTEDHIHIACSLPRTLTVSKLLEEVKKSSSAWMKQQGTAHRLFAWQAGYGAFSLGQSQLPALLQYIDNQREHHHRRTFKEEFVAFLERYCIDYDERYLWD